MTSKMWDSDQLLGFQSFFKVFTQISPEGTATFGWNILVMKWPVANYALIFTFRGFLRELAINDDSALEYASFVSCTHYKKMSI